MFSQILKAMVGFLLAVVTIKFLYLLRYKRTFSNLGNFYKRAYRELFVFSVSMLIHLAQAVFCTDKPKGLSCH